MLKRLFQERGALRTTGNATLVLYSAACVARSDRSARRLWHGYLATHAVHGTLLVRTAMHARGRPFTNVSRYGGAVGYATVVALTADSYVPGAPRGVLQRAGQHVLFSLYAFTIVHGYLAKGRDARVYAPLAALWVAAALRGRARTDPPSDQGPDGGTGPARDASSSTFVTV